MNDLQKKDMPRERLIELGPSALSDVELLAILIGSGTSKQNVFMIAKEILKLYRLDELKDLSYERLIRITGIKQAKACQLLASFELARRSVRLPKPLKKWNTPKEIYDYVYSDIYLESRELVIVLYLNCKLELLKKRIYKGSSTFSVELPYKDIIRDAVDQNAYGIVLVHNHPSGDSTPSQADIDATYELCSFLKQIEVLLLDHLVVSQQSFFSFEESGLFSLFKEYTESGDTDEKNTLSVFRNGNRRF